MPAPDFTSARWRKSSRSNGEGACVEVAWAADVTVTGVRDSKQHGRGPVLAYSQSVWTTFLEHVKTADLA